MDFDGVRRHPDLSPTYESTLAEMFQRSTAMPVVAATDGATVSPNAVSVILSGRLLASANGHLRLPDSEEHRGKLVAVDYFPHAGSSLG